MTNLADELERLALKDGFCVFALRAFVDDNLPAILSALRGEPCRECQAVSAAIGSVEFMDPPDGGDVPLSEQVRRMRAALDALRAKPEGEPVAWPDREAVARVLRLLSDASQHEATRIVDARDALTAILALPQAERPGFKLVPVEALEEVRDLLAERRYGNPARSPGHNARLAVEAMLREAIK